jgi:hypothetical protein|nr:MAG TPA: hypothetical protein [Caudoviricetes sp.]
MVDEVQLKKTLCFGALNEDVLIIDLTVKDGFVHYSIIERTMRGKDVVEGQWTIGGARKILQQLQTVINLTDKNNG